MYRAPRNFSNEAWTWGKRLRVLFRGLVYPAEVNTKSFFSVLLRDSNDRGAPRTGRGLDYSFREHSCHFLIYNCLRGGVAWRLPVFYRLGFGFQPEAMFGHMREPRQLVDEERLKSPRLFHGASLEAGVQFEGGRLRLLGSTLCLGPGRLGPRVWRASIPRFVSCVRLERTLPHDGKDAVPDDHS